MAGVHLIALVAAVITIAVMVELLRRRQLRQKYALMWVLVGLVVAVIAITPGTFNHIAHRLGVISPPDLLVVLAALFLLLVCVHLSWEIGRLEDRSRRLAEELTLVRKEVEDLSRPAEQPIGTEHPSHDRLSHDRLSHDRLGEDRLSQETGDAGGHRQPTP